MKVSTNEVKKIVKKYNLGKLKSIVPINSGWVSFSFDLKTSKGKFILQFLGKNPDKWKQDKLKLEFALLEYLNRSNFPYLVPLPLKYSNSEYFGKIKGKTYWIYLKINGNISKSLNEKQFRECAKASAIYHKYANNFKFKTEFEDFNNFNWISRMYEEMKKVKPQDKTDLLMLNNMPFFEEALKKIKKINYGAERTFCRSDFNNANILFKKEKIIGIIDFDNIQLAPKASDIGNAIVRCQYHGRGYTLEKKKIFLEEYRKIMPLSKKDEDLIIPLLLKNNCITFWWFYKGMNKHPDMRNYAFQEAINEAKDYYIQLMEKKLK